MPALRRWHGRLGAAASVFVAVTCLTGLYLNHKSWFVRAHHSDWEQTKSSAKPKHQGLNTSTDADSLKVSLADVIQKANQALGDNVPIDEMEMKDDHGAIVYKLKADDGRELIVNAHSGEIKMKAPYYEPSAEGFRSGGWDWNEIIGDVHTGKFFGGIGTIALDFIAISILILSVSGIWLFLRKNSA